MHFTVGDSVNVDEAMTGCGDN